MKIDRLVIEGFGPFRDRQEVDLDRYASDGIFLISGRTGTGKSSILDAICFALYGSTPRYDDGERRFRSDYAEGSDPTSVALEMTVGDDAWRVVRTPQYDRPKRRGEGTTTEPSSVELFRRDGEEWIGVAAKEREVAPHIIDIVGMSAEQFQQVILLAQGRFARFLLAKNDDRQRLLRSLFGTRRFAQYEAELDEQRKVAETGIREQRIALNAILDEAERLARQVRDAGASAVPGDDDGEAPDPSSGSASQSPADPEPESVADPDPMEVVDRIACIEAAHQDADDQLSSAAGSLASADAARSTAETVRDERRALAEQQRRRDTARATIAELDALRGELDAQRREVAAARRAETVRTAMAALDTAVRTEERARAAADAARSEWVSARASLPDAGSAAEEAPPADDADAETLAGFADDLKRRIGGWEPLRAHESGFDNDAEHIGDQRERLRALDEVISVLAERDTSLPGQLRAAQEQREEALARASQAETIDEQLAALEAQRRAVREVAERSQAYARAEEALAAAKTAHRSAEDAVDALHRRRLAGYSSELAQDLEPGVPCAVCGSTEHPHPAQPGDDHVTSEAIEAAEAEREQTAGAHEHATSTRRQAELDLRGAETRTGGRSAAEIDGELRVAKESRADIERSAARVAELDAALATLERQRTQTAAELSGQREAKARAEAELRGAERILAERRADVDAARGAYGSLGERIDAARALVTRATECARADEEQSRAAATRHAAREALDAALATAEFETADAASAALRPPDDLERLDRRITEFDSRRATAQSVLDELAGIEIPTDPVVLDDVEAALSAARAAHTAAVERRGSAEHRATALGASLRRATAAHDAIRERADEVAVITRLADTVAGRPPNTRSMNLETFVLAAELEEIVRAANVRLAEMSDNRYALRHTDEVARRRAASGLGIEVFDAFSGRTRPAHSLSGGETFLASLALALGLAEVVTNRAGGIRLDTLFIDEGFGSLDAETLETAMRTLDDLRQGGRTVGLISHVEAMKEQIPAQLKVRQERGGWSVVEQ